MDKQVRLVRCPKCQNLLPELADLSVYQCGGCGAVLRANGHSSGAGGSSEKSAEERNESGYQKSEKGVPEIVDDLNTDMKPDTKRQDQSSLKKGGFRSLDGYKDRGKGLSDVDLKMELDEVKPLSNNVGPSQKSERYRRNIGRDEADGTRNLMNDVTDARLSNPRYSNEGPSSYHPGLSYGYKEQTQVNSEPEAPDKVEYLDQNRADLLRKLDELKDQLSKSCDLADKPKENAPLYRKSGSQEPYSNPKNWSPGGASMPNRDSIQFSVARERISDPSYLNRYPEPYTYSHRPEIMTPNIFPSSRDSSHFPVYVDPYESHLHRRPMNQVPGQYNEKSRPYLSGQYLDNDSAFHHPSCTCFHCCSTRQYVPPPTFRDRRFQAVADDPIFYHRENHPSYTSHAFNPPSTSHAFNPPSISSHGAVPLMSKTSDLNSEEGSLQTRPQRALVASGRVRCFPVAGGAPFITCCNCFELLHLPERGLNMDKQNYLRCGECSTVISYAISDKKLVVSVRGEKIKISDEVNDSSSEMVKGKKTDFNGHMNRGSASCSFNDYDNTGYEFESLDREPILMSSGRASNSSKQQDMQSYHSSSPSMSDNVNSPDIVLPTREDNHSSEQPVKALLSPPPAGSPLQDYFDYSGYNNQVNGSGKGNQSSRSDHENLVLDKPTTRQNSVKEIAVATEMDMPYNEFSNTGVSQDSGDRSREYDQRPVSKRSRSESFFGAFIKKSIAWSNQGAENCKASVSINGHPISDQLVKKAEKLAGPVRPGQYWYDVRAGFWGVMGGPCLGIIPPSIEEFNHPMPGDCAGGDTGVYVNGRELQHNDLDLLVGRGLPNERNRCYVVDISGRVWDEKTGEELDCLGKLAPTIEKVKHGFGMKVPRISA